MSRRQLPSEIRKIEVLNRKTGKKVTRYELRMDAGVNQNTGQRQQVKRRYATDREARKALGEIAGGSTDGTFVGRSALTVERACAEFLAGSHSIEPTTRAAYEHALQPLRDRHGDMPVQALSKSDLDRLVNDLVVGTSPGHRRKWVANSINPMLNLISRVLADLVAQGKLTRDGAALVKRLKRSDKELQTFSEADVRKLLKHVENNRLGHAWHLAFSGMRRGEISGLLWSDVDLEDGTVTIRHNRVSVGGQVHNKDPKTETSARTLPLTPALKSALRRAENTQKVERMKLGPDYGPGEHVVVDEAGRPYHPDTLSDFWRELCVAAKVKRIRLH
ncbi:unnamed protein product, partial [marine sediment metagenome]